MPATYHFRMTYTCRPPRRFLFESPATPSDAGIFPRLVPQWKKYIYIADPTSSLRAKFAGLIATPPPLRPRQARRAPARHRQAHPQGSPLVRGRFTRITRSVWSRSPWAGMSICRGHCKANERTFLRPPRQGTFFLSLFFPFPLLPFLCLFNDTHEHDTAAPNTSLTLTYVPH